MEPIVTALISAGVAIVASFFTYLGVRSNTKKDIFVTDRQQLSQEQQDFRKEMREELKYWREKYDKLELQMDEVATTNFQLQAEVTLWKEKYDRLYQENSALTKRVTELEEERRRRRNEE